MCAGGRFGKGEVWRQCGLRVPALRAGPLTTFLFHASLLSKPASGTLEAFVEPVPPSPSSPLATLKPRLRNSSQVLVPPPFFGFPMKIPQKGGERFPDQMQHHNMSGQGTLHFKLCHFTSKCIRSNRCRIANIVGRIFCFNKALTFSRKTKSAPLSSTTRQASKKRTEREPANPSLKAMYHLQFSPGRRSRAERRGGSG